MPSLYGKRDASPKCGFCSVRADMAVSSVNMSAVRRDISRSPVSGSRCGCRREADSGVDDRAAAPGAPHDDGIQVEFLEFGHLLSKE